MDFKCDGELRQQITLRMGTNLMYNMVTKTGRNEKLKYSYQVCSLHSDDTVDEIWKS
eukprot:Skav207356  [mRNA]  locus=scaffold426:177501:179655:- [translate_table: standard]